jgi:hypothetical protein
MLAMTAAFAVLGAVLGSGSGLSALALRRRQRQVSRLSRLLDRDLGSLLAAGEGERLELKASARWDYRKVARALGVEPPQELARAAEETARRGQGAVYLLEGGKVLATMDGLCCRGYRAGLGTGTTSPQRAMVVP